MLVSRKQVESNLGNVSSEQIGRCTKVYDHQQRANVYMVLSERDNETEYKVSYSKEHGFSCECPSGEEGFSNVRHASRVCKHVRWACAAAKEEKAYHDALLRKELETEGVISIARLNDYQGMLPYNTSASIQRIITQIVSTRGGVALNASTNRWEPVA